MDFPTVAFDTSGTGVSARLVLLAVAVAVVFGSLGVLMHFDAARPILLVFLALGMGVVVYGWLAGIGSKSQHYQYLLIDPEGVHFWSSRNAPEQLFRWEHIQAVKPVWNDDGLVGIDMQVRAPAGWPQSRIIPLRRQSHVDEALALIRQVVDVHSHSSRQPIRA